MTDAERQAALEQIAAEIRICTRCRLHQQRTRSVPGEGNPDTEVVFVGEGPGFNEDREGRPFVGRAGGLLVKLLASIGWRREDVFITNVVKCRPPENRDPEPDEIAACAPYLRRQLAALDPALVVTLGRYSMGTFMPGARIGQAHGTVAPVDPAIGTRDALAFAMYHPAAALRSTEVERTSFADVALVPAALLRARERREPGAQAAASEPAADFSAPAAVPAAQQAAVPAAQQSAPAAAQRAAEPVPEPAADPVAEQSVAPAVPPGSARDAGIAAWITRPLAPDAAASTAATSAAPLGTTLPGVALPNAGIAADAAAADSAIPADQLTLF